MKRLSVIVLMCFSLQAFPQEINSGQNHVKNSVHLTYSFITLTATYERWVGLGEKSTLLIGGGVSQVIAFGEATIPSIRTTYMSGKTKHHFEGGLVGIILEDFFPVVPMVGYRMQAKSGLLFRIDLSIFAEKDTYQENGDYDYDLFPLPGISIGYSF